MTGHLGPGWPQLRRTSGARRHGRGRDQIVEAAFETRADSTIADDESRETCAKVVEWILESPADQTPTPDDIVRRSIELIITDVTLTEVGDRIRAEPSRERRAEAEQEIRDAAEVYASQVTLNNTGARSRRSPLRSRVAFGSLATSSGAANDQLPPHDVTRQLPMPAVSTRSFSGPVVSGDVHRPARSPPHSFGIVRQENVDFVRTRPRRLRCRPISAPAGPRVGLERPRHRPHRRGRRSGAWEPHAEAARYRVGFLTGDRWTFSFAAGCAECCTETELALEETPPAANVLLSGGADSAAGALLTALDLPRARPCSWCHTSAPRPSRPSRRTSLADPIGRAEHHDHAPADEPQPNLQASGWHVLQ